MRAGYTVDYKMDEGNDMVIVHNHHSLNEVYFMGWNKEWDKSFLEKHVVAIFHIKPRNHV